MPGGFASLDCCGNRAAMLMAQNDEQWYMQVLSSIFQAAKFGIRYDVSRYAHNKQIPKALIKENLRRYSGIRATQDFGMRMLTRSQLPQPRRSLVRMRVPVSGMMRISIL